MACSYAAPGSRKKHSGSSSSSSGPGDMQNRIDRLEGLVLSLMTNGAQSAGPAAASRSLSMSASTGSMEYPPDIGVDGVTNQQCMRRPDGEEGESETDQVAQSLGVLKVFDNKAMYYGEAHWATILQDVCRPSFPAEIGAELTRMVDFRSQELLCGAQETTRRSGTKSRSFQERGSLPTRPNVPLRWSESTRVPRVAGLVA